MFATKARPGVRWQRLLSGNDTPDDENQEARAWISQFKPKLLPTNLWKVTFSRSSGPGGQNVNKCVQSLYSLVIA